MNEKDFLLVSSSLATKYGLNEDDLCYTEILKLQGMTFDFVQKNSLLISQATELIAKSDNHPKKLVLHFGTSVGWPKAFIRVRKKEYKLTRNEYYFDLPAYSSRSTLRKLKTRIKFKLKVIIKYILLPLGLYKPKISTLETKFAIAELLQISDKYFDEILWIQHTYLISNKSKVEKKIYTEYYNSIISAVLGANLQSLTLAIPSSDFRVPLNYSIDEVHLSPHGHRKIADTIISWAQKETRESENRIRYF